MSNDPNETDRDASVELETETTFHVNEPDETNNKNDTD